MWLDMDFEFDPAKSDANLQHDLISAPVQLVSSGRDCFASSP